MRVLVTGASGFVARQVLAPLKARATVIATARRDAPGLLGCDLLDEGAQAALLRAAQPDIVLHAAWDVTHGAFWTSPSNEPWAEASIAFARQAAALGVRRFVGLGTCAEYATSPDSADPWPERRPIDPATPYGRAKARVAASLSALPIATGWARLFHLFGPGEAPGRLVSSIALAIREGQPAPIASGRPVRDFAATPWLGRALAALALSPVTGPVNVATGQPIAIRALAEAVAAALGRPDLLRVGALPDRPGEVPSMVADTGRLRREVGFTEQQDLAVELRRLFSAARPDPRAPPDHPAARPPATKD